MNITVCIGSSCHLKGSRNVVERLERLILERDLKNEIELRGSFCMGQCQTGVSVLVDDTYYSLTPEDTERFFIQTVLPKLASTKHAIGTQIEPV
ncbi:MAG: (2Fe-2S) ferredoxin domain-containing protein [Eubacteriales bacterium]|nr:(2Fe-2S) ferredoxin domain-containing protein [Eubacteriales bacterium]